MNGSIWDGDALGWRSADMAAGFVSVGFHTGRGGFCGFPLLVTAAAKVQLQSSFHMAGFYKVSLFHPPTAALSLVTRTLVTLKKIALKSRVQWH